MTQDDFIISQNEDRRDALAIAGGAVHKSVRSRKKFVRSLQILLPVLALGLVALLLIWPQMDETTSVVHEEEMTAAAKQEVRGRLVGAEYESRDSKNRPFTITADEAEQDKAESELVHLSVPVANIQAAEDTQVSLKSLKGHYYQTQEKLLLEENVVLHHQNGDELYMESVTVMVDAGQAESTLPVSGKGPSGELQAKGMKIIDMGHRIIFTGPATLVMETHQPEEEIISDDEGIQDAQ